MGIFPPIDRLFPTATLRQYLRIVAQPGAWALERSLTRPLIFCIFQKSGKNKTTDLVVSQLWGSTIAIISAHVPVPGQHMWASAGPGFKFSKSVQVGWSCLDLQLCQHKIATDEIQERKNSREHSNIKSTCVSALTCSVPHKMTKAWQRVWAFIRNQIHVTWLSATVQPVLTTKPLVHFDCQKKTVYN